jgi:hypothetical protein
MSLLNEVSQMTNIRVAAIALVGLVAACSKQGPDEGAGGSGGSTPTGDVPLGGKSGTGGSAGGGGSFIYETDLPCLRDLFAPCAQGGACTQMQTDGGSTSCYASGVRQEDMAVTNDCHDEVGQRALERRVYKPDGTLCYTYSWSCICNTICESGQGAWRNPAGDIVATSSSGRTTTVRCAATGETCPSDRQANAPNPTTCKTSPDDESCSLGDCP